jgi:Ala-tRNA(Pro) deacylase
VPDPLRKQFTGGSEPTSPDELLAILDQLGIGHTTVKHPPMFTVAESKKLRITSARGSYTKNLFLRNKKGLMWLITCSEDRRLDLPALAICLKARRLSFGSADRLMKYLGVTPGAVSPLALINDSVGSVSFIIEKELLRQPMIHMHPLINTQTTRIAIRDLLRFIRYTGHSPLCLPLDALEAATTTERRATRSLDGANT